MRRPDTPTFGARGDWRCRQGSRAPGPLEFKSQWQIESEHEARKIEVASLRSSWKPIQAIWLHESQETFLRGLVELSEQQADDRAWLDVVH